MRTGPNIALAVGMLTVVIVANALLFDGALGHWAAGTSGRILVPVSRKLTWLKGYSDAVIGRFDAASELMQLQEHQRQFESERVLLDQLKTELEFYRSAAAVRERLGSEPIKAGAFSWPVQSGAREIVVNRGTDDTVEQGDTVVTPAGALLGVVREVFADHAVVVSLGDVGLEVTARIADSAVSGLVRSDGGGVLLDLVQKGEEVMEGQLVVTGGNDRIPPGLLIGTVRSVDPQAATLFVPVRIAPAVKTPYAGEVLIVRP